jgi:hypothetical protein
MRFLAPFLFFVTSISSIHAATLSLHAIDSARALVLVEGQITPGDAHSLQAYIESSRTSALKVTMVSFNSPGGNLEEGYKIATEIIRARLATEVESEKICASACFFAFAAGTTKWTAPGARVGVHGAADANGIQSGTAASATIVMARWAAKELGIPSDIIGKMVMTPPSDIIWLSNTELASMGAQIRDRSQDGRLNPTPSDPEAFAGRASSQQWPELLGSAVALSRVQNGGVIRSNRFCSPSTGACELSVAFQRADGRSEFVRTIQDRGGQTISRAFCTSEPSGNLRQCMDWDTKRRSEEQKGSDGQWTGVN